MALIRTIPLREADEKLASIYYKVRRDMVGWFPLPAGMTAWNIMRVFTLRPEFFAAFERAFLHFMWDGKLRRVAKEAIGVTVATTNRCEY